MFLHLQSVVNRHFGIPPRPMPQRHTIELHRRQSLDVISSARALLLKKLSSVPKKKRSPYSLFSCHISSAMRAGDFRRCCRWLYAGIGQYGQANLHPKVITSEPIGLFQRTRLGASARGPNFVDQLGGSDRSR